MAVSSTQKLLPGSILCIDKQVELGILHAGSIPFNPSPEGSALLAKVKGFLFYSFTLLLSVPLFISMLVMTPFVLLFDKYRYVQRKSESAEQITHTPQLDAPEQAIFCFCV